MREFASEGYVCAHEWMQRELGGEDTRYCGGRSVESTSAVCWLPLDSDLHR